MRQEQEETPLSVSPCLSFSYYSTLSCTGGGQEEEPASNRSSDSEFEFLPHPPDGNHDQRVSEHFMEKLSSSEQITTGTDEVPSTSDTESEYDVEEAELASHCIWNPNSSPPSSPCCNKSNSTGSSASSTKSKMWRIKDLLRRSTSDGGKDSYVLLTRSSPVIDSRKTIGKPNTRSKDKLSPHEAFYVKTKALKEDGKRRSYLPYKQDIVGFFSF